jgi:hypothetical protein
MRVLWSFFLYVHISDVIPDGWFYTFEKPTPPRLNPFNGHEWFPANDFYLFPTNSQQPIYSRDLRPASCGAIFSSTIGRAVKDTSTGLSGFLPDRPTTPTQPVNFSSTFGLSLTLPHLFALFCGLSMQACPFSVVCPMDGRRFDNRFISLHDGHSRQVAGGNLLL